MSKERKMLIINSNPYIYELSVAINGLISYRNNLFKLMLSKDKEDTRTNFVYDKSLNVDKVLIDICYAFVDRELIVEEDILLSNITDTIISTSSKHIAEENIIEPLSMLFENGMHQELYPLYLKLVNDDEYLQFAIGNIEGLAMQAIDVMVDSMLQLELNGIVNRDTLRLITSGSIIPNGIGLFYENNQKFKILEER